MANHGTLRLLGMLLLLALTAGAPAARAASGPPEEASREEASRDEASREEASREEASRPGEQASQQRGVDLQVTVDSTQSSGSARASVRIHASLEDIWGIITSCREALKMIPGLVSCEVLETSADGSWQRIRHVLDYSWYVPRLTYEMRADYHRPDSARVERISGDLRSMHASWTLTRDGDYTIAHYWMEMTPGFWVPRWVMRGALDRDLPKMMEALRSRAESLHCDRCG